MVSICVDLITYFVIYLKTRYMIGVFIDLEGCFNSMYKAIIINRHIMISYNIHPSDNIINVKYGQVQTRMNINLINHESVCNARKELNEIHKEYEKLLGNIHMPWTYVYRYYRIKYNLAGYVKKVQERVFE